MVASAVPKAVTLCVVFAVLWSMAFRTAGEIRSVLGAALAGRPELRKRVVAGASALSWAVGCPAYACCRFPAERRAEARLCGGCLERGKPFPETGEVGR